MGAGVIAAADEHLLRRRYALERRRQRNHRPHPGWVVRRPYENEIVEHDLPPVYTITIGYELRLGLGRVSDDGVHLAAPGEVEDLA